MSKCMVLGKKIVGRKETIEYAAEKFGWKNCVIGISAYFGVWAWVLARLTNRKFVYYCIDFYSPRIAKNRGDALFIKAAMRADKLLVKKASEVWDISVRINEGRQEFGGYRAESRVVPLSYPPSYFRYATPERNVAVFVGLEPYGLELFESITDIKVEWLGKEKRLPIDELLEQVSKCAFGISLWRDKGNNYYGDPGKTKLYSACGLPVIMTDNTPYAKVIRDTFAGIVIKEYSSEALRKAIKEVIFNYGFYKRNVKKTWEYINADIIFRDCKVLEY